MSTPPRKTSGLAIASLVSGILGWSILPLLGSIVAIVTGHIARNEVQRAPDRVEGSGMALAGLILGYSALALSLAAVVFLILVFGGIILGGGIFA